MAIILGIDPGSRITGYGVIELTGNHHRYITSGSIVINGDDLAKKLLHIYKGIEEVISITNPTEAAIEQVFLHQNPNTALKLGHARGVAMVAASGMGLAVAEYAARVVKKSVVGYGAAQKSQVQHMVRTILNLSDLPQVDAADALAVALCHAHHRSSALKGVVL